MSGTRGKTSRGSGGSQRDRDKPAPPPPPPIPRVDSITPIEEATEIHIQIPSFDTESVAQRSVGFSCPLGEKDAYVAHVASQKNLLLLGKSGAGKTTLFEVLKSPHYITPLNQSLFAGAKLLPEYTPILVQNPEGKHYSINVIDTPGLFEVRSNEKEKRSNEKIFSHIEECIRENATRLSAIFILIPVTAVLIEEDLELLRLVKQFLGDSFRKNTFLIFSKADMFKIENLQAKISEFLQSSISQPFLEYCQGGMFFSGATSGELVSEYGETYEQRTREKVTLLRQYLIDTIMSTEDKKLPPNFGLDTTTAASPPPVAANATPVAVDAEDKKETKSKKK